MFVALRTRRMVFSSRFWSRARRSTCTRTFLAVTTAVGAAACSVDLGYLDNGTKDGPDASITDATMDSTADHASSDGQPNVDDGAGQNDVNGPVESGGAPTPALPPDAGTFTCPTTIIDSISSSDLTQTGRLNRLPPGTACGTAEQYPGNNADTSNEHFFLAYRFVNPNSAAATCYTFTLNYGPGITIPSDMDAGDASTQNDADAGDASTRNDADAGDASNDADAGDASAQNDAAVDDGPARYMSAYSTFYPTNLALGFQGYAVVGYSLGPTNPPMTMSVTIPAGGTADVVVAAIDPTPNGPGPYPFSLSCDQNDAGQ